MLQKKRLTLTGSTGTRYLYSTGQALTVHGGGCLLLPRYDLIFITLHLCAKHMLFLFSANACVVVFSLSDNLVFLVALVTFVAAFVTFFFFWRFSAFCVWVFLSVLSICPRHRFFKVSVTFCARMFVYPILHLDSGPSVRGLVLRIFLVVPGSLLCPFHSIYTPCYSTPSTEPYPCVR